MENTQSPCPRDAHVVCGGTGTQVADYRTEPSGGEVNSMDVMEAGNNFSLSDLGTASQFSFFLLCETYSILLQVTTPICAPLSFVMCVP